MYCSRRRYIYCCHRTFCSINQYWYLYRVFVMSELSVCFVSQQPGNGKWSSFRLSWERLSLIIYYVRCNLQLDKHRGTRIQGIQIILTSPANTAQTARGVLGLQQAAALTNRANTIYTDWKICFRKKGFKLSFQIGSWITYSCHRKLSCLPCERQFYFAKVFTL